jgi:hypothetical protein
MAEVWRTKSFKNLLKTWNKKLEQTGFVDAEVELKEDRSLKQRATNSYRQATELERDSRLEYFRIIGNLANNTKFPNDVEKLIMLRHSEGETINSILKEVKSNNGPRNRKTVRFTIRRWQMKWGIKYWTLKQMNLKSLIK